MIKIISQKLYIRVAISIALVAIVVSLVSSMLSYYSGFKEKKNTNYLLVQQLAQTMEKTAAIAAYLNDKELSQEIINGLLSNDLVQGASLEGEVNPKGEIDLLNNSEDRISVKRTILRLVLGISTPITDLPSMTSTTLTLFTERDLAISCAIPVILLALVPGAG